MKMYSISYTPMVESEAALKSIEVDYAQGYGIGKPMPISEILIDFMNN